MLPKWQRQNWWLLTGMLAGISSTISTEWNQAAATTSKCMIQAPAAETAQRYTTTAGTKALLATSPCLNTGHRRPSSGNLTQPLCSLPRAQFPSRHCSVPTFPREKKRQQSIWISLLTDLTRLFFQKFTDYSYFPNQKVVLFHEHVLFLFQEQNGTAYKY